MSQLEDKIAAKRDAYAAAVERALEDPEGLSREPMPEDDESEEESDEFEEEYAAPTTLPVVVNDADPFTNIPRSRSGSRAPTHKLLGGVPTGNRPSATSVIDPDDPFGDIEDDDEDPFTVAESPDPNDPFGSLSIPELPAPVSPFSSLDLASMDIPVPVPVPGMATLTLQTPSLFGGQTVSSEDPFDAKRPRAPSQSRGKSQSVLSIDDMFDVPSSPSSPVMALSSANSTTMMSVQPSFPEFSPPTVMPSIQQSISIQPAAATNPFGGSPKSIGKNEQEVVASLKAQMAEQRAEAEQQIDNLKRSLSEKRTESRARSQSQLQELQHGESHLVAAKETVEHLTRVGRAKDDEIVKVKARAREVIVDLQEQLSEKDLELESAKRKVRQLEEKMVEAAEAAEADMLEAVTHYSHRATADITKKIVVLEERVLSLRDAPKIHRVITSFVDAVYPTRGEDEED